MVDFQSGFIEIKVHGISIFPTHNLEVLGYWLRSLRLHRLRRLQHCYYKTLSWIETRGDFTDLWLSEFLNYETATFFEKKSFYRPCSNFVATLSLHTKCLDIATNLFDDFCLYYTQCRNCRKSRWNTTVNYLRHILAKKIYHKCRMSHLLTIFATIPRHSGG